MKRMLAVAASCLIAAASGAAPVPRSECFPLETLPAALRPTAEKLLLKALDGEALYTIIGGLKPMSSGWYSAQFDVERPQLGAIDPVREIVRTFRNGDEVVATVQPFWRVYEGRRYVEGVFYHRPSVAETIRRHGAFFGFYGVSPNSHPVEATMAFEVDATSRRNRGYGYLYGYPKHAVDFFVASDDAQRRTGKLVPRDFLSIPVYEAATHRFVYAVPKGQAPNEADLALRRSAEPILAYYRHIRPRYIGAGKPGVAALLRDWFHDGRGAYSSNTARQRAVNWYRHQNVKIPTPVGYK